MWAKVSNRTFLLQEPQLKGTGQYRFSVLGAVQLVQTPHAFDDLGNSLVCIKFAMTLGYMLVIRAAW